MRWVTYENPHHANGCMKMFRIKDFEYIYTTITYRYMLILEGAIWH